MCLALPGTFSLAAGRSFKADLIQAGTGSYIGKKSSADELHPFLTGCTLQLPALAKAGCVRMKALSLAMRVVCASVLLAILNPLEAEARLTRRMCVEEQVTAAQAVFTGTVESVEQPSPAVIGTTRYAVVKVERVLKGQLPRRTRFVLRGPIAELNPNCCEVGHRYLFMAHRGYPMFDYDAAGEFVGTLRETDRYTSAVNGPFSTYGLAGREVLDWPTGSGCEGVGTAAQTEAFERIRKALDGAEAKR